MQVGQEHISEKREKIMNERRNDKENELTRTNGQKERKIGKNGENP